MWIDVGKLIGEHVPDKNGKVLPADLVSGSYELRDLSNTGVGNLFEGKVVYDKTYGHVTYGCGMCCGYSNALLDLNPLGIPFGNLADNGVSAQDGCSGVFNDVSSFFYNNWSTANTSIATVNAYGTHRGVAAGATTSSTHGYLEKPAAQGGPSCPKKFFQAGGGDNVDPTVSITGSPGVPLGHQGGFSVTIGSNPNNVQITISISTTTGSGDATFNGGTHSITLSGGATVPVDGVTTSSTADNLVIQAKDPGGVVLASTNFSVVSVTLSIRSGTGIVPSRGNSAAPEYESVMGTNSLAAFASDSKGGCFVGAEFVGSVLPSNYKG